MCGTPDGCGVALIQRDPNVLQERRALVCEQAHDLGGEFLVAMQAADEIDLVDWWRRRHKGVTFHFGKERAGFGRLRQVAVHSGGEAALAVAAHGMRDHRDNAR